MFDVVFANGGCLRTPSSTRSKHLHVQFSETLKRIACKHAYRKPLDLVPPRDDKKILTEDFVSCAQRIENTRIHEVRARIRAYNLYASICKDFCIPPRPFKLFLQFPHGENYRSFFQRKRSVSTSVKHARAQAASAVSNQPMVSALGSQFRAHLIDTGSSYHLIDPESLTKKEMRRVEDLTVPLRMSGVGGHTWARQQVEISIPTLQCKIMMFLVKGTAPIISVGKLAREQRIKYVWPIEGEPYFELPNGKMVECTSAVDVSYVAAAVGSTPSSAPSPPVGNAGGDSSTPDSPKSQIIVSPQPAAGSPAPAPDAL